MEGLTSLQEVVLEMAAWAAAATAASAALDKVELHNSVEVQASVDVYALVHFRAPRVNSDLLLGIFKVLEAA